VLSTRGGVRTLGIDLGSTRTVAASAGVALPLLLPAVEDSADALRAACAAARLEPATVSAVVVVPDARAGAILDAGRAAGLASIATMQAAIAIALAYSRRALLRRVAVLEIGARGLEAAVVELGDRPARVVAREAAPVGGADVDRAIARSVADRIARTCGWDLGADPEVWARLVTEAERAKLRLARDAVTSIDVAHAAPPAPTQLSTIALDRRALRDLAGAVIARALEACDAVLEGPVDAVLLAGGSAMLPGVREEVSARVGAPALAEIHPGSVAAIGASLPFL
jgi:molecular chaperone DnaK (HSP70)